MKFYSGYRVHNYHFAAYGAMFLGQYAPAIAAADPEIAQTGLLIAFDVCDLDLGRLPGLQLRHQFDPPHQFRHQLILVS